MIRFDHTFLSALSVISGLGVFTNGLSLYRLYENFNYGKSVYFLIRMDSLISFCASFVQAAVFIVAQVDLGLDKFVCFLFQIVPFVSVSFGFLFTAILAAIRYKSVKNLHSELAETRIYAFIITASVCLLCFIVAYFASILVHDVGMGAGPEYCLKGENFRAWHYSSLFPLLAVLLFSIISLCFDAAIIRHLRNIVQNMYNIHKHNEYMKVPVRATTFSALCLIPLIILGMTHKLFHTSPTISAYMAMTTAVLVTVLRAPLTFLLTFKSIKSMEDRLRQQARNKRLLRELTHSYRASKKIIIVQPAEIEQHSKDTIESKC